MFHPARLGCATALTALLVPQIASAQITADDVWQNIQDYLGAFSRDVTATTARSGNTLSVSDVTLNFTLPMDVGTLTLTLADTVLSEQGDGTVAITYPKSATYGFVAEITDKGTYSGTLDVTFDGSASTASGDPGDITYAYSFDQIAIKLGGLNLEGDEGISTSLLLESGASLIYEIAGYSGTSRISVGDLVTTTGRFSAGNQQYAGRFGDANGGMATFNGKIESLVTTTSMALPRGGMDIMNLATAVQDGLAVTMTTTTTGYDASQTTEVAGKVVTSQSTRAELLEGSLRFDRNGVLRTGTARVLELAMQPTPDIPVALEFRADLATGNLTIPLSASPELQDVAVSVSMEGLTMADQLWSMFDPGRSLPRDPMTISLDMSARVKNLVNWLDVRSVMALPGGGKVPVELHAATLNGLTIDMAGARLTGSGAARFDNSDLVSFGGFPKPVGTLDLALSGGNGLIDTLVGMGLMSEEDAMGARMMMAGFASADPDAGGDALKSRLEINEEGHVFANGQRLR